MDLIVLSSSFYQRYKDCDEILCKDNRPYLCLCIKVENRRFAIPFRHHISHKHCFITYEDRGLDYTKAVPIVDSSFIGDDTAWIDSAEWNIVKQNEGRIYAGFNKYLKLYRKALRFSNQRRYQNVLKYSALQYFEL